MSNKCALLKDTSVRVEVQGSEALLIPFIRNISSQRIAMVSGQLPQALIVDGAEFPRISTGWENKFGEYEFNSTTRTADIRVISVIKKFTASSGSKIIQSPSVIVIYEDLDTHEVSYFERKTYTDLGGGFGYMNKLSNHHLLSENSHIRSTDVLSTSPNHTDNGYAMGINANVAFMTSLGNVEDAFLVSQSMADRLTHPVIETATLKFDNKTNIPLNMHGNEDEFKIIPDIGEVVDERGILAAIRNLDEYHSVADTTPSALRELQDLHDLHIAAPEGSEILDVTVYCDSRTYASLEKHPGPYKQLLKYTRQYHSYYENILDAYQTTIKKGFKVSPKLNDLVYRAYAISNRRIKGHTSHKQLKLKDKRSEVAFLTVEVTYKYTRTIDSAFKVADRSGGFQSVVMTSWPPYTEMYSKINSLIDGNRLRAYTTNLTQ